MYNYVTICIYDHATIYMYNHVTIYVTYFLIITDSSNSLDSSEAELTDRSVHKRKRKQTQFADGIICVTPKNKKNT